jgi:hypothetical protein
VVTLRHGHTLSRSQSLIIFTLVIQYVSFYPEQVTIFTRKATGIGNHHFLR